MMLLQRKAWSQEGNGDSGEAISNTDCNSSATTTAHSKVTAAPGANPQPQGKKKCNEISFFFTHTTSHHSIKVTLRSKNNEPRS